MKRIIALALAAIALAAAPASADEPLSIEVGKTTNDWGHCTYVQFDVIGEYNSYFLYHEDQLMASETRGDISSFRLLGTVYGVPGQPVEFGTTSTGTLDVGTYTLTVVDRFGAVTQSTDCGDVAFEAALNGWDEPEPEVVHPVEVNDDFIKEPPKATTKKAAPKPYHYDPTINGIRFENGLMAL
jgi:hypothetical protein